MGDAAQEVASHTRLLLLMSGVGKQCARLQDALMWKGSSRVEGPDSDVAPIEERGLYFQAGINRAKVGG